jgi:hypothetical protein
MYVIDFIFFLTPEMEAGRLVYWLHVEKIIVLRLCQGSIGS